MRRSDQGREAEEWRPGGKSRRPTGALCQETVVHLAKEPGMVLRIVKLLRRSGDTWDWDVPHPAAYMHLWAETVSFGRVI